MIILASDIIARLDEVVSSPRYQSGPNYGWLAGRLVTRLSLTSSRRQQLTGLAGLADMTVLSCERAEMVDLITLLRQSPLVPTGAHWYLLVSDKSHFCILCPVESGYFPLGASSLWTNTKELT